MIPFRDNIPSRTTPVLTVLFIALNVVVHFYKASQSYLGERAIEYRFGVVPASFAILGEGPREVPLQVERPVRRGGVVMVERLTIKIELPGTLSAALVPLLTSMFLHGNWLHLIGNMWFLWLFGDNVEDRLGRARYLVLYLASGLVAALSQVMVNWGEVIPMIGASGAVAGVLGAYMISYPYARVLAWVPFFYFFWPVVELPALLFLGFWFLFQFFQGAASLGGPPGGGVAWWAHVGGFIAGIVLVWLLAPRDRYETRRDIPLY